MTTLHLLPWLLPTAVAADTATSAAAARQACEAASTLLPGRAPVAVVVRTYGSLATWFSESAFDRVLLGCLPDESRLAAPGTPITDTADVSQADSLLIGLGYGGVVQVELHPAGERVDAGVSTRRPAQDFGDPIMLFFEAPRTAPAAPAARVPAAPRATPTPATPPAREPTTTASRRKIPWTYGKWPGTGRLPDASSAHQRLSIVGLHYLLYDDYSHGELEARVALGRTASITVDAGVAETRHYDVVSDESSSGALGASASWALEASDALVIAPYASVRRWGYTEFEESAGELGLGSAASLTVSAIGSHATALVFELSGYFPIGLGASDSLAPAGVDAGRWLSPRLETGLRLHQKEHILRVGSADKHLLASYDLVIREGWTFGGEAGVGLPSGWGFGLRLGFLPGQS